MPGLVADWFEPLAGNTVSMSSDDVSSFIINLNASLLSNRN